jgi:hypothetical protein
MTEQQVRVVEAIRVLFTNPDGSTMWTWLEFQAELERLFPEQTKHTATWQEAVAGILANFPRPRGVPISVGELQAHAAASVDATVEAINRALLTVPRGPGTTRVRHDDLEPVWSDTTLATALARFKDAGWTFERAPIYFDLTPPKVPT